MRSIVLISAAILFSGSPNVAFAQSTPPEQQDDSQEANEAESEPRTVEEQPQDISDAADEVRPDNTVLVTKEREVKICRTVTSVGSRVP